MRLVSTGGYSAKVALHVRANSNLIPLTQVAYDRMILEEPIEIPPGRGELIVDIDDSTRRYEIEIGEAAPGSLRIPIRLIR